jgi:hypothetical protein
VTLLNRSVTGQSTASAQQIADLALLSSPIQRTRSRTASDQADKVDGPVSRSSFGQLPAIFPLLLHWAFIHLNCHPLCDPISASLIALPVNAFQCLIHEVLLIIFLSLTYIGNLQQSVDGEKYYDCHFRRAHGPWHSWNDFIPRPCKQCRRAIIVVESVLLPSHEVPEVLAWVVSQWG